MENIMKFEDFNLDDILIADANSNSTSNCEMISNSYQLGNKLADDCHQDFSPSNDSSKQRDSTGYSDDFDVEDTKYDDDYDFEEDVDNVLDDHTDGVSSMQMPISAQEHNVVHQCVPSSPDNVLHSTSINSRLESGYSSGENVSVADNEDKDAKSEADAALPGKQIQAGELAQSPLSATPTTSPREVLSSRLTYFIQPSVNSSIAQHTDKQIKFAHSEVNKIAISGTIHQRQRVRCLSKVTAVSHLNLPTTHRKLPSSAIIEYQKRDIPFKTPHSNIQRLAIPIRGLVLGSNGIAPAADESLIEKEIDRVVSSKENLINTGAHIRPVMKSSSSQTPFVGASKIHNREDSDDQEVLRVMHRVRVGNDRHSLLQLYETVHSTFLADVIDICRKRAKASGSPEELVMHRVLSEIMLESFGGKSLSAIQMRMMAAAVDASLANHA